MFTPPPAHFFGAGSRTCRAAPLPWAGPPGNPFCGSKHKAINPSSILASTLVCRRLSHSDTPPRPPRSDHSRWPPPCAGMPTLPSGQPPTSAGPAPKPLRRNHKAINPSFILDTSPSFTAGTLTRRGNLTSSRNLPSPAPVDAGENVPPFSLPVSGLRIS